MKEKLQWEIASHLLKGLKCRRSVISSLDKDMDNWNSHILLVGNFVVSNKFGHKAYPKTSNFYPLTHAENNSYLCFWTMVLEKTLESRLDSKKIKPINPKGNQSWLFIGRTDAEAETPTLWPPDAKNWLIGKDPNTGKVWRQEEKRMTEDEMVGWHHQLNGCEFEQALGAGDGQGSLACCNPWGCKESDMTQWLNWTDVHQNRCTRIFSTVLFVIV